MSQGYNLIGNGDGCRIEAQSSDLIGGSFQPIDPRLTALSNHGGQTLTHALLPDSPAIDAGDPAVCPPVDQRGFARPKDGDGNGTAVCDIGAFELEVQSANFLVTIDIRPRSEANIINLENERVYVAILSTATFDAATVDANSLTFGRTGNEQSLAISSSGPACNLRDVNDDQRNDLVCAYVVRKTRFQCGDKEGIIKGHTLKGTPLIGRDSVEIQRCPQP
jgi:hypothetical protein